MKMLSGIAEAKSLSRLHGFERLLWSNQFQ